MERLFFMAKPKGKSPWYSIAESYMGLSPGFRTLAMRIVLHLNVLVRRGEMTERGLAKLTGYSQPHVHNVLKGARGLSADLADQILELLAIKLVSLFTQDELSGLAPPSLTDAIPVPILQGRLGSGKPFPRRSERGQRRFFPLPVLTGLVSPTLAVLDRDELAMSPTLRPNDWVLLDRSPGVRRCPSLEQIYALSWKGRGFVGRCRVVGGALLVVVDNPLGGQQTPSPIPLAGCDVLEIVKGKLVWLGRALDVS